MFVATVFRMHSGVPEEVAEVCQGEGDSNVDVEDGSEDEDDEEHCAEDVDRGTALVRLI